MWPSLEVASRVSDVANIALVCSLVVGVVATVLIVWAANVKESHWDTERLTLVKETARLSAEAEKARGEIAAAQSAAATATERAATANERAALLEKEAAQLGLDLENEKKKRQGRVLLKEQFDAIQAVKGKLTHANVMSESNAESMLFSHLIIDALEAADVEVRIYFPPPNFILTGIEIWSPNFADPPMDAFTEAGLMPGWGKIDMMPFPGVPHDVPLIVVGERPLELGGRPYFGPPKK